MTRQIRKAFQSRDRQCKCKCKSYTSWDRYRVQRNLVVSLARKAKINYITTIIFSHPSRDTYFLIHVHNGTRKLRASIWGKLRHCQTAKTCSSYKRNFSNRRK